MTSYVSSKYPFFERNQTHLNKQLQDILGREGTLFQDPVLQLVRTRKSEVFDRLSFHPALSATLPHKPYSHQIKAWKNIQNSQATVVATGTGSGKSECFMFPMIDTLLKKAVHKGPKRVCALLLYPMNALVEDQFIRLQKYTTGTGLRVGIYNGAFKKLESNQAKDISNRIIEQKLELGLTRAAVEEEIGSLTVDPKDPATIPHILLTNYKMLEYMLLRPDDHPIFADADLQFLVLDEAHTYTGTLGLEMSCLIARLRIFLGQRGDNFLPIATSATLMQKNPGTEIEEDNSQAQEAMREFFSQLFGKEFPKNHWLIEDEFEPPPPFDPKVFHPFLQIDREAVRRALRLPNFTECLSDLAKLYCRIPADATQNLNPSEAQHRLAALLYEPLQTVARQLPALLLREDDQAPIEAVVRWERAKQRFTDRLKADPVHLEALLILCSQAYKEVHQPLLGLRVHVFGKSEPRTFWTLDDDIEKRQILDEQGLKELTRPALDFISCRKCGHSAWLGLATPVGPAGAEQYSLEQVPAFYEDMKLQAGSELVVLHHSSDINQDVVSRKSWRVINCDLDTSSKELRVRWLHSKAKKKAGSDKEEWTRFVRIEREGQDDQDIRDDWSCPACGATSNEDRRPVLLTPRGSGATDLSVYGASVMSALELPEERRLLFFCDNRQETSFLAGFLSDRHRRFNLRRAIASFLDTAKNQGFNEAWTLIRKIDPNRDAPGHRFDFAARLLLSVKNGRYWGQDPLPSRETVSRYDLVDLIPRDVLETDWLDRQDKSHERIKSYKDWLLDNRSLQATRGESDDLTQVEETIELFHSDQGQWILEILTEVILIEISTLFAREGSLQNVGLATWGLKDFHPRLFADAAHQRPEWKLSAQGLFLLSHWFLQQLADLGLWELLSDSTRRHGSGQRAQTRIPTLKDIISKGLDSDKPLNTNSRIGRLIDALVRGTDGDKADERAKEALQIWNKSATWMDLLKFTPLERYVFLNQNQTPKIKSEAVLVFGHIRQFKGNNSPLIIAVDPTCDLRGQPTGKKNDFWQAITVPTEPYYRNLYLRSFEEEPRLIRALEHNGMLGANRASEVLQEFSYTQAGARGNTAQGKTHRGRVNTLVASPTLEMGVDLPDLPVVIHRSVPPDPSNYAQRAGRAGRGPKRAFIVTHCGLGSHDLSFYESPEKMVSGEILPPGLPRENAAIIRRHVNGLVLSLLTESRTELSPQLRFNWWGDLVDLKQLRTRYKSFDTEISGEDQNPIDWEAILKARSQWITSQVKLFVAVLRSGLWQNLPAARLDQLEREVYQAGEPSTWRQAFQSQLQRYLQRADQYMKDLEFSRQRIASASMKEQPSLLRQQQRAMSLARLYLTRNEENYPLSYLGMNGFLPSFDFPGRSVRFVGVQSGQNKGEKTAKAEQYLKFTRSADVALKEFAPEQIIYGQGFKYKVDRYIADGESDRDGRAYGICKTGCAELSDPEASFCQRCGGELLSTEDGQERPRLIEVQEVQGYQESVISDKESKRTFNAMVRDVRRFKINLADTYYMLQDVPSVRWHFHLSPECQVETVTFLSGTLQRGDAQSGSTYFSPVYKEKVGPETKSFRVTMRPDEEKAAQYEAFWPSFFSKGQALVFKLSFDQARLAQWISAEATEENLNVFYKSLAQLLARASTRVLRLNKRKGGLRFIDDRIFHSQGHGEYAIHHRHILILDSEEGGSGVIELIRDYWDAIMDECAQLVLQDCCDSACYRCLKSYDNQEAHGSLNKSLFRVNADGQMMAPLFQALRWRAGSKVQVVETGAEEQNPTDSPAEALLETYLAAHYPLVRSTQVDHTNLEGRTITISDFVIKSIEQEEIDIFVDGYAYHAKTEKMYTDCLKRNQVAFRGRRAIILPASLTLDANIEAVGEILSLLNKQSPFNLQFKAGSLPDLPYDPNMGTSLHRDGILKVEAWEPIDPQFWTDFFDGDWARSNLSRTLKFLEALEPADLPLAHQDGVLLFPVHGHELCAPENRRRWTAALTLYGICAALGKRIVYLWVGERTRSKAAS